LDTEKPMAPLEDALLAIWSDELETDTPKGKSGEGGPNVKPKRVRITEENEKTLPEATDKINVEEEEKFAVIVNASKGIPIEKQSAPSEAKSCVVETVTPPGVAARGAPVVSSPAGNVSVCTELAAVALPVTATVI
jgi:hypothetical protein